MIGRTNAGGGSGGLKYASGTQAGSGTSATTMSVSGLGFRPYAVLIYHGYTWAFSAGICDADGNAVASRYVMATSSTQNAGDATFTPTDDGFSIKVNANTSVMSYWIWNWVAIGV